MITLGDSTFCFTETGYKTKISKLKGEGYEIDHHHPPDTIFSFGSSVMHKGREDDIKIVYLLRKIKMPPYF